MRLHVGVLAGRTQRSRVSDGLGKDAQVDADLDLLLIPDRGQEEGVIRVAELE